MDTPDSAAPDKAALDAAAHEKKRLEMRNSHWCFHKTLGLGMIGELGSIVKFHRFRAATADTPAGVESQHDVVNVEDLVRCTPDELPEHLGFTHQQLVDQGYL